MLAATLKEYQLKGLNWLANLYEQGINGILADEVSRILPSLARHRTELIDFNVNRWVLERLFNRFHSWLTSPKFTTSGDLSSSSLPPRLFTTGNKRLPSLFRISKRYRIGEPRRIELSCESSGTESRFVTIKIPHSMSSLLPTSS